MPSEPNVLYYPSAEDLTTCKSWKNYVWRLRIRLETTLAFPVMEPWERILALMIYASLVSLFAFGLYQYLPHQITFMYQRATYYLWG